MPPPSHNVSTELSDSGERVAGLDNERLAHFFRCWDRAGGPGYQLREDVADIRTALTDMTATFRTWGKAAAVLMAVLTLSIGALTYVSATRGTPGQSHIVTQAHAETKGPTP
jgi:hypothetical protein